jgi:hypothetical protein
MDESETKIGWHTKNICTVQYSFKVLYFRIILYTNILYQTNCTTSDALYDFLVILNQVHLAKNKKIHVS